MNKSNLPFCIDLDKLFSPASSPFTSSEKSVPAIALEPASRKVKRSLDFLAQADVQELHAHVRFSFLKLCETSPAVRCAPPRRRDSTDSVSSRSDCGEYFRLGEETLDSPEGSQPPTPGRSLKIEGDT